MTDFDTGQDVSVQQHAPYHGLMWLRAKLLARLGEAHASGNSLCHGRIRRDLLRHEWQRGFGEVSREDDNTVDVSYQIVSRVDHHVLLGRLQLDRHVDGDNLEQLGRRGGPDVAGKDLFPSGKKLEIEQGGRYPEKEYVRESPSLAAPASPGSGRR